MSDSKPVSAQNIKSNSVVLLSGGLDSAANLAFAHAHGDKPVLALTARYGQRAANQEITAAKSLCRYYDIRHEEVDLSWLGRLGGSSLTEGSLGVPTLGTNQLDDLSVIRDTARSVWVPNRNGVLINAAAAWAERLGASRVIVGFNLEEATTFPDNSMDFLARSSRALELSTANHVDVFTYTGEWDKRRIVAELRKLTSPKFPFELLWSCYHGGEKPCGQCESCRRLARAVKIAV